MYKKLIENYIGSLTVADVKNYAEKEGVSITDGEAKIIFDFLHKNYKALLGPNGIETLKTIKPYLSITLYEEIAKKYITTKNKFF